jgi:cell division protein FtsI (penicillin-binding protein 3)
VTSRRAARPRSRLGLLTAALVVAFAVLAVRVGLVELAPGRHFSALEAAQVGTTDPVPALRGEILDREGRVLALSELRCQVIGDPERVTHPKAEAAVLARDLPGTNRVALERALERHVGYVVLATDEPERVCAALSHEVARATGAKRAYLRGLAFGSTEVRVDPDAPMLSSLIGVVGSNGKGLSGLEYEYQRVLSARSGKLRSERTVLGDQVPGSAKTVVPAVPGTSLELTIDSSLEYEAYSALSAQVVHTKAKSGTIVVLDARTGGVLAMASVARSAKGTAVPTSQPLALTRVFEPGSVMKLTTFSGALTEGLVTPEQSLLVPSHLILGGRYFHDAEAHPAEMMTVTQVLEHSSNLGTIEIAAKLGKQGVYDWMRRFGFAEPLHLGFPGDSAGLLRPPSTWSPAAMGSVPIGQSVAVSAMQLADAFDVVADGGVRRAPHLVAAQILPSGAVEPTPVPPGRRILSAKVVDQMRAMMETVVTGGTGVRAAIPGYAVAGKTGTAELPVIGKDQYRSGRFEATFAGFAPAQDPAVVCVVTLDDPTHSPLDIYGGWSAAPVFRQVVAFALRLFAVPPSGLGRGAGLGRKATPARSGQGRAAR